MVATVTTSYEEYSRLRERDRTFVETIENHKESLRKEYINKNQQLLEANKEYVESINSLRKDYRKLINNVEKYNNLPWYKRIFTKINIDVI